MNDEDFKKLNTEEDKKFFSSLLDTIPIFQDYKDSLDNSALIEFSLFKIDKELFFKISSAGLSSKFLAITKDTEQALFILDKVYSMARNNIIEIEKKINMGELKK